MSVKTEAELRVSVCGLSQLSYITEIAPKRFAKKPQNRNSNITLETAPTFFGPMPCRDDPRQGIGFAPSELKPRIDSADRKIDDESPGPDRAVGICR